MTQILISSSLLILVVIGLRQLLGSKISHRLRYALWLLVALRLLIPVELGHSRYSVATLTQEALQTAPAQQLRQELRQPIAGPSHAQLYQQLLDDYLENAPAKEQTVPPQVEMQLRQEAEAQLLAPTPTQLLTGIWLLGIGVMAAWFLITHIRFLRHAQKGSIDFPQAGIPVPVRISPNVPTPCLVGLIRPRIYLTPASTENQHSLHHVLTHEHTHLRHLDHLWAWVRCLCLCVYWFHPLVWAAALLSKRDCELACDEGALKKLGDEERIPYGRTLLDTVTQHRSPTHIMQTATAMNETAKQLKERVSFIVKKPRNLWITAICVIVIAAIAVGCTFTGSKQPDADQNPQLLVELVHEAEAMVEDNDTITLDPHDFLNEYISNNADRLQKAVTVTDTAITLDTTDPHYQIPDGDLILDVDVTTDLVYLTFLDLLLDRHGDAVTKADISYDAGFGRYYDLDLFFYPQYRKEGFDTVAACFAAVDAGSHPAPDHSFYIDLHYPAIRWAVDPTRELQEDEIQPPAPTQRPTIETTLPLENTEGPDPIAPADATHLFQNPSGWYTKALTSIYSAPEQVDIAAFFADGFPYESDVPPTDQEWELLKDVEGFRRDENFRRMKKSAMDEVLMTVFGITLDQTQGVGLDRLTYLEETDCYYFMSSKFETPQIWIDETTARPDYLEYLDASGNRYYVNLTVTETGSGYDYKLYSHWMEEADRQANTISLAGDLGLSYAEFLYLSEQIIQKHLSQQGYTDPETAQQVAQDAIAMYERSLYRLEDKLMLRFRYLSLADRDDPLRSAYTVPFDPGAWDIPDRAAVSHRWLLELEAEMDGAYADSYYFLLTDAMFSDPERVVEALSHCPEDQILRIAQALPYGMDDDEALLYLTLLDAVQENYRQDPDTTAGELDTLELLRQTFLATAYAQPLLPDSLTEPIGRYEWYRAVGVCCDFEYVYEDMSQHLTEEQKEDYYDTQYRLTCCSTPEEVRAHIQRYLGEEVIDRWPDEDLFTDDLGQLYLIVLPTGRITYREVVPAGMIAHQDLEQVIKDEGKLVVHAGAYDESGYLRTMAFTIEQQADRYRLTKAERLDEALNETQHYHEGLQFFLDSSFTTEVSPDAPELYTFENGMIQGTIFHSTMDEVMMGTEIGSSRDYAYSQYRLYGSQYPNAWVGDYQQQVYYTVLRSDYITEVRSLYTHGTTVWEVRLQCPTEYGRLAQMIHLATNGFTYPVS